MECGYETVKHTWQYNNYFDEDGHELICSDCGSCINEQHRAGSSGKCVVCSYTVNEATNPEAQPEETTPAETTPAESNPVETEPTESNPVDTDPTESNPVDTEPTESNPVEIEPTETKPAASETMPENAANEDSQRSSAVGAWVAAIIVVACGLGAAAFIWKKKSS